MTTYEKHKNQIKTKLSQISASLSLESSLCHYTDISGIKGILETNNLWLTDKNFMNDKLESNYSKELLISCLKERNTCITMEECNKYLDHYFNNEIDYVFSFSTEIDAIHQWNYYGGQAGYCLVYSSSEIINAIVKNNFQVIHGLVIYDYESQKSIVQDYLSVIDEWKMNKDNPEYFNFKRFENSLRMQLGRFKQHNHSCEKEYRIIVHSKNEQIRIRNGYFIPYIEIDVSEVNPAKIIVSPKLETDLAIEGIRRYLKCINRTNIVVEPSSLQIR